MFATQNNGTETQLGSACVSKTQLRIINFVACYHFCLQLLNSQYSLANCVCLHEIYMYLIIFQPDGKTVLNEVTLFLAWSFAISAQILKWKMH